MKYMNFYAANTEHCKMILLTMGKRTLLNVDVSTKHIERCELCQILTLFSNGHCPLLNLRNT